ncbi:nose resistant to fluoxetine protein 6-like isoform X2 [Harmonia axyridis]|uniref:nose resistant to fluoxetine protein 6-like isoform X2 n=1 Tax=Harmonia axyridis TaxID=115357 RepID=UPI001E2755D0|nr:nose resistant to fluoxetine protein 6-like isoform X2 [Harmonia axyridis]
MSTKSTFYFFFSLFLAVRGDFEHAFKNEISSGSFNSTQTMSQCISDLQKMGLDLKDFKLSWAWRMLDATSKLRSGLAVLSDDIGQFDECISTTSDDGDITGKYCLGSISFDVKDDNFQLLYDMKRRLKKNAAALAGSPTSNYQLTWAACLPSSCGAETFEIVFSEIFRKIQPGLKVSFSEEKCATKNDDNKLTTGAIITIVIFCIIFLIMLLSTGYDIYCQNFSKKSHPVLLAFSMYTNSKKLFTMTKNNNQLECLNGLKFYSMLWVLLGHTYSIGKGAPLYNYLDLVAWADNIHSMILISGTLSVDTFFIVGGALVTYVYMQSMEKGKKFNIIIYYLHRYIRLTPALAALVLVVATVYPYLGNGPHWSDVRANQKMCQDVWWATIFYFQNYLGQNEICAGHSWYLAVDMQLYLLSPIILYLLRKFPKQAISGLIAVIIGICGMNFGLAWSNHYHAILSNLYGDNTEFMMKFYIKTHNRANVWLTGVLVGYVIHQIKQKKLNLRMNKIIIFAIWVVTLVSLLICIFIGHGSLRTKEYQQWGNSLHIALIRQYWAMGISWIMVACISGYGGPVNWFLSLPIYQVLNRFTYSVYIVHYMIITLWFASMKSPIYFSDWMMGYFFWGNLCFTSIVSYFWVLAFESPIIILEKIFLMPLMKS